MKRRYILVCISVLGLAGCNKAPDPPPVPIPDYEAMAAAQNAADEDRAAHAHLTLTMTDEQVLRAIGVDPAMVKLKPAPEGYGGPNLKKKTYTNESNDIEIS